MRRIVIVSTFLLLSMVCTAQDWIDKDGIEYNCKVVRRILADFGNEPLTRQSGSQGSVKDYFEEYFRRALISFPTLRPLLPEQQNQTKNNLQSIRLHKTPETVAFHTMTRSSRGPLRSKHLTASPRPLLGQAKVGDIFEVTGSKRYGAECWVATGAGWLFGNYVRAAATATLEDPSGSTTDTTTDTQAAQDNCYPYDDAIVTRDTTLRLSPRVASPHDELATVGETFEVLGSNHYGFHCWVETITGWLIGAYLRPSDLSTAADSPSSCYEGHWTYVTGTMNIRESHTTASPVVGQAHAVESYKVTKSHQGETWCWLQISKGWMALTSYVSNDIIDVLPPIKGDEQFKNKVVRAFEFISGKSPRWFGYTVPKIQEIRPDPDLEANARVVASTGRVTISSNFIRENGRDFAMLASTLIHEACHVHQWDRGKALFIGLGLGKGMLYIRSNCLVADSPRHPDIEALRCWGKHYPITSLCNLNWNW